MGRPKKQLKALLPSLSPSPSALSSSSSSSSSSSLDMSMSQSAVSSIKTSSRIILSFGLAVAIINNKRKRASTNNSNNSLSSGDNDDTTSNASFDADVFSSQRDKLMFMETLSDLANINDATETEVNRLNPNYNANTSTTTNCTITSRTDTNFDINGQSTAHDTEDSQNTFSQAFN